MNLSHRIKLYPSKTDQAYFAKACGIQRFSYNWALATWKEQYKAGEKPSAFSLTKLFNSIRHTEFPWTDEVTKWACQRGIQNVEAAYKKFWKKTAKYPKFKKKGKCKDSFYFDYPKVDGHHLHVPKLGWVRMSQAVRFPGKLKSVVISRTGSTWFASISVDVDQSYVYPHLCKNQAEVVGIDLGLTHLVTLSDGTKVEAPRVYRRLERKVKRFSRELSRKTLGSNNRTKARLRLSRLHQKISDIRSDVAHKVTSRVVRQYGLIGVESLSVMNMVKNRKLAKSLQDASFGELLRQLKYKAKLSGSVLVEADRWFPSSKLCSKCGHQVEKLELSIREWICSECGTKHDRDVNAALNLRNIALRHRESNACGESVRLNEACLKEQLSAKQELSNLLTEKSTGSN